MVKFKESDIRPSGRNASGVKGINLSKQYDAISLGTSLEGDNVLVITSLGYGKISKLEDYRETNRGSKGVITLKGSEKRGDIVTLKIVKGDEDLLIITKEGETIGQELLEYTHHGVTQFEGQGCYLKENKTMLYTVVGADEVKDVVHLIKALDPHVFINIINSEGVTGRFYQEPIE